jgi:hypothetical protein
MPSNSGKAVSHCRRNATVLDCAYALDQHFAERHNIWRVKDVGATDFAVAVGYLITRQITQPASASTSAYTGVLGTVQHSRQDTDALVNIS